MPLPLLAALPVLKFVVGVGGTIFGGTKLANFFIDQQLGIDRAEIVKKAEADIRRGAGSNTALANSQIQQLHRDITGLIAQQEKAKLGDWADLIRIASFVGVGVVLFGAASVIRSFRSGTATVVVQGGRVARAKR